MTPAFAGRGGLLGRTGFGRRGSCGRSPAPQFSALPGRGMAGRLTATGATWFLAASIVLVDGRPRPLFGFLLADPALLITLCDVIGFAFLFVGVFRLVAARHFALLTGFQIGETVRQSCRYVRRRLPT